MLHASPVAQLDLAVRLEQLLPIERCLKELLSLLNDQAVRLCPKNRAYLSFIECEERISRDEMGTLLDKGIWIQLEVAAYEIFK